MNNVELYLILALLNKENYTKYRKFVHEFEEPKHPLSKVLYVLDSILPELEAPQILPSDLTQKFFVAQPYLSKTDQEFYSQVFQRLETLQVSSESIQEILAKTKERHLCLQIAKTALALSENGSGKEKLQELSKTLFEDSDPLSELEEESSYVTTDLDKLLESQINAPGLNWRLQCLNESLGPLRKGDFGFIFARPETGKTTFLASELSFMLDQVPEDKHILWFNNEEQGEKVMLRCYQAYFGVELDELRLNSGKYKEIWDVNVGNKLRIVDSAIISRRDILDELNDSVSLAVFDQLDKVKGFSSDRRDVELGSLYAWSRELAKEYCPIIGVCQASASAENKMWLYMDDVTDAKTAKQAEADWILGIGAVHDNANIRYFNISKNKLVGGPETLPESRHGRFQTIIKPEVARYDDI